jgi:hypothetical protein
MQLFGDIVQTPGKTISAQYRSLTKEGGWKWMEGTGQSPSPNPVSGDCSTYRDIESAKADQTEFVTSLPTSCAPLTTMKWYTEALRDMAEAKSKTAQYIDAIYLVFSNERAGQSHA